MYFSPDPDGLAMRAMVAHSFAPGLILQKREILIQRNLYVLFMKHGSLSPPICPL